MFFIDTQPMVQPYLEGHDMPDLLGQDYKMQLAWLEEELSTSDVSAAGLGSYGPVSWTVARFSSCLRAPAL
jgi:hypothetical protein